MAASTDTAASAPAAAAALNTPGCPLFDFSTLPPLPDLPGLPSLAMPPALPPLPLNRFGEDLKHGSYRDYKESLEVLYRIMQLQARLSSPAKGKPEKREADAAPSKKPSKRVKPTLVDADAS